MKKVLILLLLTTQLTSCYVIFWNSAPNHLQKAEELSRQGKYSEAIENYRLHMQDRLLVPNRPEWENPYFYQVLIGDIQLGQGQPDLALSSYLAADEKKVDSFLIADRIRSIGQWYEKNGRLQEAIDLLKANRTRDDLLFDSVLDRYAKELVKQEEEQNQQK